MGNLKTHTINHTGIKKFKCPYEGCEKIYPQKCRLEIHIRTHTGIRPFKCEYEGCNKTFNEKGNLYTHQRKHNGERPFKCTVEGCNEAFKSSLLLKNHVKIHNINPSDCFKCFICHKKFSRYSTLMTHKLAHIEENKNLDLDIQDSIRDENPLIYSNISHVFNIDNNLINYTDLYKSTEGTEERQIPYFLKQFEENPEALKELLLYLLFVRSCSNEFMNLIRDQVYPMMNHTNKIFDGIKMLLQLNDIDND